MKNLEFKKILSKKKQGTLYSVHCTMLVYCLLFAVYCNAQSWEWVKLIQPADNKSYMSIKVGVDGKIYAAGNFNSSIDLDNSQTISGNWDGFVAQFDTAGLCQWKQKIYVTTQGCGCTAQGNTSYAKIAGFDSQGNIIVYGGFCGCGETFGSSITSSAVGFNLFLAKYSPLGVCLWVKTKPGSFNSSTGQTIDEIDAVTIDSNDNIYVSMLSYATSTTFCGLNFANQGEYIFKIKTNGIGIWNKQTANTTTGYGIMQMQYMNKRLYASSQFGGTITFGTHTLTAQGSLDVAALKMDTAGNILAAADIGATSGQTGALSLALSNNKIVLLNQAYTNAVSAGTYTLNTGTGKDKTFLVAYDTASLSVQNIRTTATDSLGSGSSLYNDTKGNIYVTVNNGGGATGFGGLSGVPAGRHVIKMDNTLTNYWHMESVSTCVAPDTLGNLYITDGFNTSASYGSLTETSSGHGITLGKIKNAFTTGMGGRLAAPGNNMSVYPNPSDGLFNLKTDAYIKNKQNIVITLYDNNGRQIDNVPYTQVDSYTLQVDLSSYAKGLYMIKTEIDNVLYSAKLER